MVNAIREVVGDTFGVHIVNSALKSGQNRVRMYITNIPFDPSKIEDEGIVLGDVLEEDGIANPLMTNKNGKSHCLTARYNGAVWWNSIERKQRTMVLKDNPTMSKDGLIRVGTADLKGHDSIKRVYAQEGKAPTLTTMQGGHREPKINTDELHWRALTPLECERLQTVPDYYTSYGLFEEGGSFKPISNSQRYKMLGNGWTVDVVKHIFEGLIAVDTISAENNALEEKLQWFQLKSMPMTGLLNGATVTCLEVGFKETYIAAGFDDGTVNFYSMTSKKHTASFVCNASVASICLPTAISSGYFIVTDVSGQVYPLHINVTLAREKRVSIKATQAFKNIRTLLKLRKGNKALEDKILALPDDLSGGQKQRFSIACALVNNPKILFLDEPTTGLDPQAKRNLWNLVKDLNEEGMTIVLTTHNMEEAEYLCDRIAIMDKGSIIAQDTPQQLILDFAPEPNETPTQGNIEDVFLILTGHGLRD